MTRDDGIVVWWSGFISFDAPTTLYVGLTADLDARLGWHNEGKASGFTRSRRPVTLVYFESLPDPVSGRTREQQIKRWTRAKKEALIAGDLELLKRL